MAVYGPVRNRFDQLAKQIGQEALSPSGVTVASEEISPETQHADLRHEPNPERGAERARLGLLGRLASVPCLLEIYGHAPNGEEFRACLAKHIAFWQQRARKARAQGKRHKEGPAPPEAALDPFLWVIAAGAPSVLLDEIDVRTAPDWPEGVYFFGGKVLRVGVVVASALPRDRASLLVRLMAAGPLLKSALDDLAALPMDAHERAVAEEILVSLRHALEKKPSRTPEEEELFMTMLGSWENEREIGRAEQAAEALLTVLEARGIAVPDAARQRILAQKDRARLRSWLAKAAVAASVNEILDAQS